MFCHCPHGTPIIVIHAWNWFYKIIEILCAQKKKGKIVCCSKRGVRGREKKSHDASEFSFNVSWRNRKMNETESISRHSIGNFYFVLRIWWWVLLGKGGGGGEINEVGIIIFGEMEKFIFDEDPSKMFSNLSVLRFFSFWVNDPDLII